MQLFLDTANLDEIREAADMGLIDGVTTNPSLMAKESGDPAGIIREICSIVDGPVSAEILSTEFEEMLKEATAVAKWHPNVVVKVPLTADGLKTVHRLSPQGVRFNVTLCFSLAQALLAAKVGAAYVSPFVGRWDDIDTPGIELIPDMVQMFDQHGFETQILVASVRSPLHVSQAALVGADVATLPLKVLKQMIGHPLTDIGLAKFLADARGKN
ncbi:MAG: fructose-6-phosphate aldolase [Acidobacteria bacterium]|nr:fructose-6-phosphate aldolase [Acidobacteriota bacterium]MCB9396274.1 fructose-6-phosphate aldolase [Acidobacteriota bacterium]